MVQLIPSKLPRYSGESVLISRLVFEAARHAPASPRRISCRTGLICFARVVARCRWRAGVTVPLFEIPGCRIPHPLVCGEGIFNAKYYNFYQLVTLVWPAAAALCFLSVLVPWAMALNRQRLLLSETIHRP